MPQRAPHKCPECGGSGLFPGSTQPFHNTSCGLRGEYIEQESLAQLRAKNILKKVEGTDEPIFVLRAKDMFSLFLLAQYWDMVEKIGPGNPDFEELVASTMQEFRQWQMRNPDRVKYPD